MTASRFLNSLARRGFVLMIAGAKLRVSPASLLADQDRELIRQFRHDIIALLSDSKVAGACQENDKEQKSPVSLQMAHERSDEIARWPIPDRQRWGELANQFEDDGASGEAAVERAYETVLAEREVTGRIFLYIEEHSSPDPFPEWDELIDPRDYLPKPAPPRPLGSPTCGVTKSIRVVELASWSPSRQAKDPVIKVAAEGWDQWYSVEEGDLPRMKEVLAASASQDIFDWEAI